MSYRYVDVMVGGLMIVSIVAFFVLAIKVSGVTGLDRRPSYVVSAQFSNIGGLKVRAPVTVAGVKIGEVSSITLQPQSLNAKVTMKLRQDKPIPYDGVSARILTQGLLGSNYVSIVPGFEEDEEGKTQHPYLIEGDNIQRTQEAVILENLIGQLMFNLSKKEG